MAVDVGQHVGDVLVGEAPGRHHAVELVAVDGELLLEAAGDGLDRADLVAVEIVGLGERRERVGHALAVRLMAGLAIVGEDRPRRA